MQRLTVSSRHLSTYCSWCLVPSLDVQQLVHAMDFRGWGTPFENLALLCISHVGLPFAVYDAPCMYVIAPSPWCGLVKRVA